MDSREELIARLIGHAEFHDNGGCAEHSMIDHGALLREAAAALATPSPAEAGNAEAGLAMTLKAGLTRDEGRLMMKALEASSPLVDQAGDDYRAGIEAAARACDQLAREFADKMIGVWHSADTECAFRKAAKTVRALAPPDGAGGWQPIASAPKDGTEIIGYRPDQGVFVFRWAWMEEFVPKDQHGDPTEPYDEDFACWWHDRWDWMEGELTPTLWQPLPAAPGDGG